MYVFQLKFGSSATSLSQQTNYVQFQCISLSVICLSDTRAHIADDRLNAHHSYNMTVVNSDLRSLATTKGGPHHHNHNDCDNDTRIVFY